MFPFKLVVNNGLLCFLVEKVEDGLPNPSLVLPSDSLPLLENPRAGSIRISVTDSGVGLTAEQLALICSEGVQFNANELQAGKGSGLGLFITKGIVEQHGGKLTVTSAGIGAGTTFTVELPLFRLSKSSNLRSARYQVAPQNIPPCALVDAQRSLSAGNKTLHCVDTSESSVLLPKRILVVDDVLSNRKMLVRILTNNGYVCEQAEDGQQALNMYRASLESGELFYAITMDSEMPVMNGPTATGLLRALGCSIPIIAVTGNMLPDDVRHFKAQGASEVLGKPLSVVRFKELMLEYEMFSKIN
jgi:CheY-like chemotaxis protein